MEGGVRGLNGEGETSATEDLDDRTRRDDESLFSWRTNKVRASEKATLEGRKVQQVSSVSQCHLMPHSHPKPQEQRCSLLDQARPMSLVPGSGGHWLLLLGSKHKCNVRREDAAPRLCSPGIPPCLLVPCPRLRSWGTKPRPQGPALVTTNTDLCGVYGTGPGFLQYTSCMIP
ncbi:hypothetical protein NDU88_006333 [Pleurodeles waltl]|uniref:Uncharacterized protein n=1 Tax=Pleurodeles waltl TaxID=8319 RepID=A0AAV7QKI2_PLEWA|nr:hypothetical protein NDU88_006333 [Pleurodeles waltl]